MDKNHGETKQKTVSLINNIKKLRVFKKGKNGYFLNISSACLKKETSLLSKHESVRSAVDGSNKVSIGIQTEMIRVKPIESLKVNRPFGDRGYHYFERTRERLNIIETEKIECFRGCNHDVELGNMKVCEAIRIE